MTKFFAVPALLFFAACSAGLTADVDPEGKADEHSTCVGGSSEKEPNDSRATATELDAKDCVVGCDNALSGSVGGSDADYYYIPHGFLHDDALAPWVSTSMGGVTPGGHGIELCMFVAQCATEVQSPDNPTNTPAVTCQTGSASQDASGLSGCCATGPITVRLGVDCGPGTGSKSADYYIRVRNTQEPDRCEHYTVTYRY
jgi:hypothetical protein